ncbi:RPE-retinal G protein-coupled receptor isoform X1 [Crotalus tigris]|uniref:RPE-retinal G protein-coupled receptor isoform X1 n=1 Tax=Crotalus tigris TaxID=88082 RepID=UPI00192F322E|nr:RPE-retinal G protein-coupled receptor isoform X1 [Crotalus tigris]
MVNSAYPIPGGFTEIEVFAIGTILLVEALFGFSLNVLTIVAFWKVKEIQTPGNFLIFNLALSDCGICINAFIAAFSSFLRYWPYGSDGCQIHGFQGFLTALTSINCAAAIAWDRYHQYCSRRKLQWNSVFFMGLFAWCFAGFWSAMPLLGWGAYDYEPLRTCCTLDYTKGDRNYITFLIPLVLFNFVIPIFIILMSYQSIDSKFRKTAQLKFNTGLPVKSLVFCWGPYSLLSMYAAVENVALVSPKILMIPALVAKTSPTVNALIYALGNENYRGGLWQFLTGEKMEKPKTDDKIN